MEAHQLFIAPEKVQRGNSINFLGNIILPHRILPQKLVIRTDQLKTLNDFQKLLGDINWIRPSLRVPNCALKPLYNILIGNPQLDSPRSLTNEARDALKLIEQALTEASLRRVTPGQPLWACILATIKQPTGVLWQQGPLLWIHPKVSPQKVIEYYPTSVANLALKAIQQCIQHFGQPPDKLIVPYTALQIQTLGATIDDWAILRCSFSGEIDNHLPKDPLLHFAFEHPLIFPLVTKNKPIANAVNIFTHGSKTGVGAYFIEGNDPVVIQYQHTSPQLVELNIVLEIFKRVSYPFNLLSDSQYVVNLVKSLECAGQISLHTPIHSMASQIQTYIHLRKIPFFIQHVRAHTGLPGPITHGNDQVDKLTKMYMIFSLTQVQQAQAFHQQYHVNSKTLQQRFKIPRHQAREIIKACNACAPFLHPPHVGVCPRGLLPLHLWQMDVTHMSEFGNLKYAHVSIDTVSGVIHASAHAGVKANDVINHCLEAWAAWNMPKEIKTDNGPAYTSQKFTSFCTQMGVMIKHGLPYNPQGQGIVERAHRTLKECLIKQKGGIGMDMKPKQRLSLALFTLNFLQWQDCCGPSFCPF